MNILDMKRKLLPMSGYYMDGGGGGGGQPTQSSVYQTNIPEYARPYVEQMLGTAQQQIFNYDKDAEGNMVPTTMKGYTPFNQDPSKYFARAMPLQEQARTGAANLGVSPEMSAASSATQNAMNRAMGTGYQAGNFGNQFQAPDQYQPGQFSMGQVQAQGLQNYQMQSPQDVQATGYDAAQMGAAQTGYNPSLQNYQMQGPQDVQAQQFDQGAAQQYMNPYMQSVVDMQQQEAQRQADIAGTQRGAQAVQAGAFGGARQAIMDAEAAKNLASQKGAIQATGLQNAYSQAQQQFNTDQAQRMQAALANQGMGYNVGSQNLAANLGVQQLGAGQIGLQTSLANLSSQQQAAVQNQAAQNQAMGMNAQQAMQAALANQQAGLTTGSQNLAANLGIQQLGAGQNLQAQLANQQALQQAQNATEQSRQFGAGQGMTAAQQRAQYGLSGQQLGEQSRQYGAGLGLQGLQTALSGAGQLGTLGQNIYGQRVGNINLQNQLGAQQQQEQQNILNQQIQNYATAQQYPMMQLANMSNLLRGMPMQSTSVQNYQAQPNALTQLGGLGLTAAGIAGATGIGKAKGGRIKEKKRPAGLAELALSKMA